MPEHADPVAERVHEAANGLRVLLEEAAAARAARAEASGQDGASAVCAACGLACPSVAFMIAKRTFACDATVFQSISP